MSAKMRGGETKLKIAVAISLGLALFLMSYKYSSPDSDFSEETIAVVYGDSLEHEHESRDPHHGRGHGRGPWPGAPRSNKDERDKWDELMAHTKKGKKGKSKGSYNDPAGNRINIDKDPFGPKGEDPDFKRSNIEAALKRRKQRIKSSGNIDVEKQTTKAEGTLNCFRRCEADYFGDKRKVSKCNHACKHPEVAELMAHTKKGKKGKSKGEYNDRENEDMHHKYPFSHKAQDPAFKRGYIKKESDAGRYTTAVIKKKGRATLRCLRRCAFRHAPGAKKDACKRRCRKYAEEAEATEFELQKPATKKRTKSSRTSKVKELDAKVAKLNKQYAAKKTASADKKRNAVGTFLAQAHKDEELRDPASGEDKNVNLEFEKPFDKNAEDPDFNTNNIEVNHDGATAGVEKLAERAQKVEHCREAVDSCKAECDPTDKKCKEACKPKTPCKKVALEVELLQETGH